MLELKISTSGSPVSTMLRSLAAAFRSREVREVAGRAGVNTFKGHFRRLDSSRANKLGGRRSHFWAAAADATNFRVVPQGVEVNVSHLGVAQRYFGGTIRPVNARALAIPATAEAYGRLPRDPELPDLFVIRYKPGGAALAANVNGATKVYFWLVKSVTQSADPSVLPSEDYLSHNVRTAIVSYLDRQIRRKLKGA
jgi:hypothetical protein